MPLHIVEIRDEITIARKARVLVVGGEDAAETLAIERALKGVDVAWDEEQTDAQPYEAELCQTPDDVELAQLLAASRRPAGLDADEQARFDALLLTSGIGTSELLRFNERHSPGSTFGQDDEETAPTRFCPTCQDVGHCDVAGICRATCQMLGGEDSIDG